MKIVILLLALVCIPLSALELQKYPILLESNRGEQVIIAVTEDKSQALIKVTGVNSPVDEVVFLTTAATHGSAQGYNYQFDGQKRALITHANNNRYTLYLPDTNRGIALAEQTEQRGSGISADMLAQYQNQMEQGIQKKLAAFDRDKNVAQQANIIKQADNRLNKQCQVNVQTNVNWQDISDQHLQKYAVGSFCAQVAESLTYHCEKSPDFKDKINAFTTVDCQFTNELKLRRTESVIQFKTAPEEANQQQFINAYFRNL